MQFVPTLTRKHHIDMEMEGQQQQAFTFASPHQDALDFDYQSWIEQSRMSNCFSSQVDKNHPHEILQLQDEADYEMSLRDLSELSLSRAATEEPANTSKKPRLNKAERLGLIIKLFLLSLSRAPAPGGKKKSFASGNGQSSGAGNGPTSTQLPIKSYQYCTNRYLQI